MNINNQIYNLHNLKRSYIKLKILLENCNILKIMMQVQNNNISNIKKK